MAEHDPAVEGAGLAELVAVIEEIDRQDEDDLFLDLVDARRTVDDRSELHFTLRRRNEAHSEWAIVAHGTRETRLTLGPHYWLSLESSHPLLLDHTDAMGQLYLKERASEAGEVLAALWLAHREIVGEWRPLARYLNSLVNPLELLRGGMGVMASGPLTLLNGYRDAISSLVEMGSILPTGPAKRWDEERMWVEENEPLVALVLPYSDALAVGRDQALASWLVAQSVEAHRVR